MYAPKIVVPAVAAALRKRGFLFPKKGDGIGKSAVIARRLAYDALASLTPLTASGIARELGCTIQTSLNMKQAERGYYHSDSDRELWIGEVRARVEH